MTYSVDRRVSKTTTALRSAFTRIVFERGYEYVTIKEVVARANVGRSTFYHHFKSKEELLRFAMSRIFRTLANSIERDDGVESVQEVLDHLWSNRRKTDAIFTGFPRLTLVRGLAQLIEENLIGMASGGQMIVPARLAAMSIAEMQVTMIEAWLRGKAHSSSIELARAIHLSGRSCAVAVISNAAVGTTDTRIEQDC